MEEYWIVFLIPIFWWILNMTYQIIKLIKLWLKYKFENIKIKEYSLWD